MVLPQWSSWVGLDVWPLGWDTADPVLPTLVLSAFSRIRKEGCHILILGNDF